MMHAAFADDPKIRASSRDGQDGTSFKINRGKNQGVKEGDTGNMSKGKGWASHALEVIAVGGDPDECRVWVAAATADVQSWQDHDITINETGKSQQ